MSERSKRLGIVDLATGELFEAVVTPVQRKIGGRWVRLFQDGKRELMLRHPDLRGQSYRVLAYLETVSKWDNEVPGTASVASVLGLHQSAVTRAYKELINGEFLIRRGFRYYLSPLVVWKGTERQYQTACRELFPLVYALPQLPVRTISDQRQAYRERLPGGSDA